MATEANDKPVIDRSRLTHGETKKLAFLSVRLNRAQANNDPDEMEHVVNELDRLAMRVIVSVPSAWLPDDVTLESEDWIDHISQDHYTELMAVANPNRDGAKD